MVIGESTKFCRMLFLCFSMFLLVLPAASWGITDIDVTRYSVATDGSYASVDELDVTLEADLNEYQPSFYVSIMNKDDSQTIDYKTDICPGDVLSGGTTDTYTLNPGLSGSIDNPDEGDRLEAYVSVQKNDARGGGCEDSSGSDSSRTVYDTLQNLNSAPTASLSANTTSIMQGETVEFDPSGSNDPNNNIQSYDWSFPDGSSVEKSTDTNETFTFTSSGDREVSVEVEDSGGLSDSDSVTVDVQPDCSFYTSSYYPPYPDAAILGEDMSVDFQVAHNDASNCPSASDINFEVCGTNLTAPDHVSDSTYTDYYGNSYDSFTASFTVQSDVTCNSQSNTVTFWNTDTGEKIADSTLSIIRGSTWGTPIHDNGDYIPQAEIIVATEMERQSFYDPANGDNFANRSSTKFFVCRGDYRGTNISSSKLVKVQDGNEPASSTWQHYRCAMNGSWMDAQCQPGQELRYDTGDQRYECFMKATQTITATYFDINSIPHSGKSNGYLAGFKIPEAEIQEYNEVMGFDPQKVDAECWMGDDSQRPTSASDSAVFTSTYSGTGDLWAIAEIPARSGVNKKTYSCVWGIKNAGSTADTHVYESTNNIPLKARDGGKESITYDRIETRSVSADISTGTARDVWSKYEAPSDGGYDQRTYSLGNHFMLNGEYPYCSGNTFLGTNPQRNKASILQNVLCAGSGGYSGYPDTFNNPP